ncbi:hypothetical protein [Desulfogranum mediterraneum]|uniref:hypothetical protein n=1 Tax=Desulfogranum mediterraneum TaxID=160661 RepID=UPI00048B636B|nr:hypothetical protein [Desulfogranum mediterraneum]
MGFKRRLRSRGFTEARPADENLVIAAKMGLDSSVKKDQDSRRIKEGKRPYLKVRFPGGEHPIKGLRVS